MNKKPAILDQKLRKSNFGGQTKLATRGGIMKAALPQFLWGTPQILSYKPIRFMLICGAGHFFAESSNSSGPSIEVRFYKSMIRFFADVSLFGAPVHK